MGCKGIISAVEFELCLVFLHGIRYQCKKSLQMHDVILMHQEKKLPNLPFVWTLIDVYIIIQEHTNDSHKLIRNDSLFYFHE